MPGDLPVFAQLALDVCARQSPAGRVETLLLPDVPSEDVRLIAERSRDRWPDLRYLPPPRRLRAVLRKLNDPGRFHGVQLVTGIQRSRASHVILHDADAIAIDPTFFAGLYAEIAQSGGSALGVQEYWDEELRDHYPHLVATWELCGSTTWLRGVRPRRHLGHVTKAPWGDQLMDTTIFAQVHTDPAGINLRDDVGEFVHFNYVVSNYRHFQNWLRSPDSRAFDDNRFLLLFIRILSDALQQSAVDVPSLDVLLGAPHGVGPVEFPPPAEDSIREFVAFRAAVARGVGEIYGYESSVIGRMNDAFAGFDDAYAQSS